MRKYQTVKWLKESDSATSYENKKLNQQTFNQQNATFEWWKHHVASYYKYFFQFSTFMICTSHICVFCNYENVAICVNLKNDTSKPISNGYLLIIYSISKDHVKMNFSKKYYILSKCINYCFYCLSIPLNLSIYWN